MNGYSPLFVIWFLKKYYFPLKYEFYIKQSIAVMYHLHKTVNMVPLSHKNMNESFKMTFLLTRARFQYLTFSKWDKSQHKIFSQCHDKIIYHFRKFSNCFSLIFSWGLRNFPAEILFFCLCRRQSGAFPMLSTEFSVIRFISISFWQVWGLLCFLILENN